MTAAASSVVTAAVDEIARAPPRRAPRAGRPRAAASAPASPGSPKRALNSSTRGPSSVSIRPANRQPTNGVPRRASSSITGRCTASTRASTSSSRGTGEYAPMPPVFGPVSPSPSRLKSCAAPSGTTRRPSREREQRDLRPSSSSSITSRRRAPATARSAASSSPAVRHTKTPLPAASPSALTTHGGARHRERARRPARRRRAAPPWRTSSSLRSAPPRRSGRTRRCRCAAAASATPATSGASGPITARSIPSVTREAEQAVAVVGRTGWHDAERGDAGIAGRRVQLGQAAGCCASRQASACSRAPDPTSSTFTRRS